MSIPQCPKCSSTKFQITSKDVINGNFKVAFIHCSICGCVVGTQEPLSISHYVDKIAKKLGIII